MLAKLKVVSVLESLPGVGKVQARRIMEELDISESRRLRGLGRNQRAGAAREVCRLTPTVDRRATRTARASCSCSPAPRGRARERSVAGSARARSRRSRWSVSWTTRAAAAGRGDGRRLPLRHPRGVRGAARRRRLPRVVRGLRRPEGHARRTTSTSELAAGPRRAARDRRAGRAGGQASAPRGAAGLRPGARRREEQRRRLEARGSETEESIARRLAGPRPRSGSAPTQFDAVVVNDDVDGPSAEVAAILAARRAPRRPPHGDRSSRRSRRSLMAERRPSLMEPRIETLIEQGRLEVHAGHARRDAGPRDQRLLQPAR